MAVEILPLSLSLFVLLSSLALSWAVFFADPNGDPHGDHLTLDWYFLASGCPPTNHTI